MVSFFMHNKSEVLPSLFAVNYQIIFDSSVVKYFFTTGMVENVGDAFGAIPSSLAYQAINIALADGVVKFA